MVALARGLPAAEGKTAGQRSQTLALRLGSSSGSLENALLGVHNSCLPLSKCGMSSHLRQVFPPAKIAQFFIFGAVHFGMCVVNVWNSDYYFLNILTWPCILDTIICIKIDRYVCRSVCQCWKMIWVSSLGLRWLYLMLGPRGLWVGQATLHGDTHANIQAFSAMQLFE